MNAVETAIKPSLPLGAKQLEGLEEILGGVASPEVGTASVVTRELAAIQESRQQAATGPVADVLPAMRKVVDALVSVVQALMSVVTSLVSGTKSPKKSTEGAELQGRALSSSPTTAGALSSSSAEVQPAAVRESPSSTAKPVNTSSSLQGSQPAESRSMFQVIRNDIGQISVRTLDGYLVRAEGKDEAWTITGPDGRSTRIWGDPHVKESDGDTWDFLTRSTFQFGNNKATAEVVPAGNGTTFTSRITLYSGDERVTIDGIDKNKPSIVAVSKDGKQHDDTLADGITYRRGVTSKGESWISNKTGKVM